MSLKKNKNFMYYDELKNDNIRLDNKFFLKKLLIQNCNKKKFIIKKKNNMALAHIYQHH